MSCNPQSSTAAVERPGGWRAQTGARIVFGPTSRDQPHFCQLLRYTVDLRLDGDATGGECLRLAPTGPQPPRAWLSRPPVAVASDHVLYSVGSRGAWDTLSRLLLAP